MDRSKPSLRRSPPDSNLRQSFSLTSKPRQHFTNQPQAVQMSQLPAYHNLPQPGLEYAQAPPPPDISKKSTKKSNKKTARTWVWTSEMEVDLLQFAMGAGNDPRDHYTAIIEFFKLKYGIEMDEGELKNRFTHLRAVQKTVLEKFGRPLPAPIKYKKSKKSLIEEGEASSSQVVEQYVEELEVDDGDDRYQKDREGLSMLLQAMEHVENQGD